MSAPTAGGEISPFNQSDSDNEVAAFAAAPEDNGAAITGAYLGDEAAPADLDLTKVAVTNPNEALEVSPVDANGEFTVAVRAGTTPKAAYTQGQGDHRCDPGRFSGPGHPKL